MNTHGFTQRQREILQHLRDQAIEQKRQFLDRALSGSLAKCDIEAVCKILNDEFLMHGILDDKYNTNEYGRELEELVDIINHPWIE